VTTLQNAIKETGVLVRLSCSYPRYSGKVNMEVFGINADTRKAKTRLSAIRKTFFSDAMKPITRLESQMRKHVLALTFPLPEDFPFRFCPSGKLPELVEGCERMEANFMEEAGSFITKFEQHREESKDSWRELVGNQTNLTEDIKSKLLNALVIETENQRTPSITQYSCDLSMVEISSPDSVSVSDLDRVEQKEVAQAFKRIKPRIDRKVHDLETNLISTCRNELYQRMFTFLADLNERLSNPDSGRVTMRTVNSAFRMADEISEMNFMHDDSVEGLIRAVRNICTQAAGGDEGPMHMDDDAAIARLKSGVAGVVGILSDTMDGKSSGDTLEVDEVPDILLDMADEPDEEEPPEEPEDDIDDFILEL